MRQPMARAIGAALVRNPAPIKDRVLALTADNGTEFADHQAVAGALGADFYFAHPYAGWERSTNENTNGLIRQYFPNSDDFATSPPRSWPEQPTNATTDHENVLA